MKRIGFVGSESADIALYLARLLQNKEKNVVVVDHTRKLSLMRNAGIPEELTGKNGMYRDIEIFSESIACNFRDDALVIDYYGYYAKAEQLKGSSLIVFVSDMLVYNAQLLKDVEVEEETPKVLILRDAIPLKYKEKYLLTETRQKITPDNLFIIPYNEGDYRSRCYLCIDKKHKLTGLSEEMQRTILTLYSRIEEVELKRKEAAALLKRA